MIMLEISPVTVPLYKLFQKSPNMMNSSLNSLIFQLQFLVSLC